MKKNLFFLVLFVFTITSVFSQLSAGLLGGGNLNYIRGEDWDAFLETETEGLDSDSPGISYGFGVFFTFAFNQSFAFRLDGMYQNTKSKLNIDSEDSIFTLPVFDSTLSFIYSLSAGPGRIYALAGPTFRYGMDDFVLSYADSNSEDTLKLDSSITFGLTGGAGYDIPLGPGYLFAEARYQFFFTGHFSDASEGFGSKMYMDSVLASIGYGYSF